jgi:hypothetical protein
MTNLLFLLAALLVATIGIVILWVRSRSPRSVDSGVDTFARQMEALSPRGPRPPQGRRPHRG